MYQKSDIESSYQQNDIGKSLYDIVIEQNPITIVEFGCLYGYSTVAMAMALKDLNNNGKIICYDLWEEYPFKHSTIEITKNNILKYDLEKFVEFIKFDFFDWLKNPIQFDLMHLDISNTGQIILQAYNNLKNQIDSGSVIVFEGGSLERDNIEWMKKYNAVPIKNVQSMVNYEILNHKFPSLSIIKHK